MYSLHYIRGISRYDTPIFATIQEQTQYFINNRIVNIDDFFPVWYNQTIKLELFDYKYNITSCNYLSILFNSKYYYYFIDNINYINEGIYSIDITLDVIQTFLFNISFNYINLSRQSIKRWTSNGLINRDYIRENLSIATSYKKDITYNNMNYNKWLLVESVKRLDSFAGNTAPTLIYSKNLITNGTYLYIIPYPNITKEDINITYYIKYMNNDIGTYTGKQFAFCVSDLMRSPDILNMSIVNLESKDFNYGITYNDEHTECTISISNTTLDFTYDPVTIGSNENQVISLFINEAENIYNYIDYEFNFTENKELNKKYNFKFIPQLIDENYIDFKFGERLGYTIFPLSKLKYKSLRLYMEYDLLSTDRIFKIGDNEFFTNIVNKTKENLRLYNNAWENYMSTNKGTLTTGISLAVNNNMLKTTKGVVNAAVGGIAGAVINPVAGATGGVLGLANVYFDHFLGLYNIEQNLKITKENLEFTPDTARQGNTFSSDIVNDSLDIFTYIAYVDDIEDVGKKLEHFGYKVDKFLTNVTLYDNVLYNRHYFDVIKAEDMSITINNYIETDILKYAVKERLNNGLRLWHVFTNTSLLDNLEFDNIEKEW